MLFLCLAVKILCRLARKSLIGVSTAATRSYNVVRNEQFEPNIWMLHLPSLFVTEGRITLVACFQCCYQISRCLLAIGVATRVDWHRCRKKAAHKATALCLVLRDPFHERPCQSRSRCPSYRPSNPSRIYTKGAAGNDVGGGTMAYLSLQAFEWESGLVAS